MIPHSYSCGNDSERRRTHVYSNLSSQLFLLSSSNNSSPFGAVAAAPAMPSAGVPAPDPAGFEKLELLCLAVANIVGTLDAGAAGEGAEEEGGRIVSWSCLRTNSETTVVNSEV